MSGAGGMSKCGPKSFGAGGILAGALADRLLSAGVLHRRYQKDPLRGLLREGETCEGRIALKHLSPLTWSEAARFRIVSNSHPPFATIASPTAPSQAESGRSLPHTLAELLQTSRPPVLEQTVDLDPTLTELSLFLCA